MSFDLGLEGYDQQRGRQFQIDVLRRVQSLPGIQSAGLINSLPLTTDQSSTCIQLEGRPQQATDCANYYHATLAPATSAPV